MALPLIIWILGGLGLAAAASDPNSKESRRPVLKATRKLSLIKATKAKGKGKAKTKTGPLPAAALAAWNAPKHGKRNKRSAYGPTNDIHRRGSWLRYATYSKNWDKKLDKMRMYSDPPGALFLKSKSKVRNLCWMMQAPEAWYPGEGKAKRRNSRVDPLKKWLGPKADWDTIKGMVKDSVEAIPDMVKAAGIVTAGVASGGASATKGTGDQLDTVGDAIKSGLAPIGNTGKSVSKRLDAADVVYTAFSDAYVAQVMAANPHAVKDGKLDIGKHYMADPLTWEDLGKPGKSRPLLYNP